MSGWGTAIGQGLGLVSQIVDLFKKDPVEKERERIEDEQKESAEIGEAVKAAKKGDTSDVEEILNG